MSIAPLTGRHAASFFMIRALAGLAVAVALAPPCVDAFFRPFHAWYWAAAPQWAPSTIWLPGYTWVYGLGVGVTGETVWTPKLLSVGFHLATLFLLYRALPRAQRTVALIWVGLAPLAFVVGSTGLSEALFGFCLVAAVTALAAFAETGRRGALRWAAISMVAATYIRYDAWPLLPVFCVFAARASRRHGAGVTGWLVSVLPLLAPMGWMGLSYLRRGDAFWFLTSVAGDRFGAGELEAVLVGPASLSAWLAVVGLGVSVWAMTRDSAGPTRLYGAFALVAAGFVGWVLASGNIPSQLPERVFYPVLLLTAPLVAVAWARWSAGRLIGLVAVLLVASATYLVSLSDAVPPAERQLVRFIDEAYAGDQLAPGHHVVAVGPYPNVTALAVGSKHADRVHLEGVGRRCPNRVLSCDSPCGPPPWRDDVFLVLAGDATARLAMETRGWSAVTEVGDYAVFFRGAAAPPLCSASTNTPSAPPG